MSDLRLNAYLARHGIASRRQADELIRSGRVRVNGAKVPSSGQMVLDSDLITLDDQPVAVVPKPTYLMLNKPPGVVVTRSDPHHPTTVMDLVRTQSRLFAVGRLDRPSRGLLLLVNDGQLAHRLTHPRYQVPRYYRATVKGDPTAQDLDRLRRGLTLDASQVRFAGVRVIRSAEGIAVLQVTLDQGVKRQIRRMLEILGLPVIDLERVGLGPLRLGDLQQGEYRCLSDHELDQLRRLVGLNA